MNATHSAPIASWRQTFWDVRAAGNFIGGGSGAGVLVSAAALIGAAPVLAVLGAALVAGGLLCVWLEIGRPWRALNVFRHPATSWMSREAIVAPLLLASALAGAWLGLAWLRWLAAALALAYLYSQARMLSAARGIPAWRHPRIPPLLIVTGLAEGCGLVVLVRLLGIPAPSSSLPILWLLPLLLLGRVIAFAGYRLGLTRSGAPKLALRELARFGRRLSGLDAIGLACALLFAAGLRSAWLVGAAAFIAVAAGWWLKFTIILRLAYNQGFALPMTPVRGAGLTQPGVRPGW